MSLPATRLANIPLFCWLVAVALGGLCYYFDAFAPYRDIRGYPKDRVEDGCLWMAAMAATIGIILSIVGLVLIRLSAGHLRGSYRLSIGMAVNLLTLLAVLFTLFVRGLRCGTNAA
jgi:tellurite resistance protein TehA-like permease